MTDELDADRIEYMEEVLAADILRYEHALKIYNRLDKVITVALGACSVGSLLLTSGTMGSAMTGVGVVASIPLGSLACLSATATLVLSLISRRVAKKKKKHQNTVRLARIYKSQILSDSPIPVLCLKNYYDEKDQLRQPSTTFSEDLSAHAP